MNKSGRIESNGEGKIVKQESQSMLKAKPLCAVHQ